MDPENGVLTKIQMNHNSQFNNSTITPKLPYGLYGTHEAKAIDF